MPGVKKAYRSLARAWHPDRNPGSAEALKRFREVQEAYELLERLNTQQGLLQQPAANQPVAYSTDRLPREVPRKGPDVSGSLELTLEEVFKGTTSDITFVDQQGCERCGATGGEPGSTLIPCPACAGIEGGRCEWCRGEEQIPDRPCATCYGAGTAEVERTVRVAVPRSAQEGEEIRQSSKGKWGMERRGDLRLRVKILPHSYLRRVGDDLETDIVIGVLQAVLGGSAYVPALEHVRHKISISPGSSSGKRFRLKGQGMYYRDQSDRRGDLYAVLAIKVPGELTEREQQIYQLLLAEELKKEQHTEQE